MKINLQKVMLEAPGIDPGTSRMLSERSTIWATPPFLFTPKLFILVFLKYKQEFCKSIVSKEKSWNNVSVYRHVLPIQAIVSSWLNTYVLCTLHIHFICARLNYVWRPKHVCLLEYERIFPIFILCNFSGIHLWKVVTRLGSQRHVRFWVPHLINFKRGQKSPWLTNTMHEYFYIFYSDP